MSMRWYVVHAYSGYEKKVALASRIVWRCTDWKIALARY